MTTRTLPLPLSALLCLFLAGCALSPGLDLPGKEVGGDGDDGGIIVGDGDGDGDSDGESPGGGAAGQGGACPLGGAGGAGGNTDAAGARIAPPQDAPPQDAPPHDDPPATVCFTIK